MRSQSFFSERIKRFGSRSCDILQEEKGVYPPGATTGIASVRLKACATLDQCVLDEHEDVLEEV